MKNLRPYSNITDNALNTGLGFAVPKFELTAANSSFTRLPNPINAIKNLQNETVLYTTSPSPP